MKLRQLFEAKARKIVAVMPGGFHPFHPGHKSLYDWAVKTFGQSNVYVAATNDTETRPFPFEVKKKLAAMAGVPESNFIQVKSPFLARQYSDLLDDNSALVFVRSVKDKGGHPLPDQTKQDGEPGYLRTYTGKDLNTADEMGYMAYGPTINFDFSGMQIKSASELRATWPEMSDEDKLKAAKLMYGNGAEEAVQLLNKALGDTEPVEEWIGPALKGGKYAFEISKWLWNNKWAITFFVGAWKTIDWISDAIAFVKKYTDNPIVQGLMRYGLPAVTVAIALYGGKKLYDELVKAENEEDLEKLLKDFKPDMSELEELEAELIDMVANKKTNEILGLEPEIDKESKTESVNLRHNLKPGKYKHGEEDITIEIGKDGGVTFLEPQEWSIESDPEYLEWVEGLLAGKNWITANKTNEILGFATKNPKRATIKKKRPPKEDSVQDKLAKRRAMAAKGNPDAYKTGAIEEGDLVLDQGKLRSFIISMISDKIEKTDDIELLAKWLKMIVGKELSARGNRYQISAEDVVEAYNSYKEDAPPGREKQVKKLKKKFDDPGAPYAIAWAQHNKHGKPKK